MSHYHAAGDVEHVDREHLIALLSANDRNGVYSDEDAITEGAFGRPWTDAELLVAARDQGLVWA